MKPRVIVHNPTNYSTKKYRYYNIFFDYLVDALRNSFDIIENRYYIDAHKNRFLITLLGDDKHISKSVGLLECEMILENYDSKELKILSVSDYFSETNLGLFNSEMYHSRVKTVLMSQFNRQSLLAHTTNKNIDNVYKPWIYFPSNLYNLDYFYHKRQSAQLIDKFYFRGSGFEHRPLIKLFTPNLFVGGYPIGNFDTYAEEAITYKVGFSCAGSAQFCYRDIEYMAMGIPMLRFKYTNEMTPPLIPNYHYISVEPPLEKEEEYKADQTHADLIEQKFLTIKDDSEFLQFISNNARKYYLDYIHGNEGVNHTLQLLDVNEWL